MSHAAARAARHTAPAAVASSGKQKTARSSRASSDLAMRSGSGPRSIPFIQPKLEVNQPGDRFERQADSVAGKVMRMPLGEEEKPVEIMAAQNPRALQRQSCGPNCGCAACAQNPREIQREATSSSTPGVSARTAATIRNPGPGQPLSSGIRSRIEPHVGASLGHVRVHSDPASSQAASSLQASAFTHQNHIFLRSSAQSSNLRLMAHESTHVVQQGGPPIQRAPMTEERPPDVQRSLVDDALGAAGAALDTVTGAAVDAAGAVVEMGADFFWSALETMAPDFVPILRQIQQEGILGYLGGIIRNTLGSVFDTFAGQPGAFDQMVSIFTNLAGQAGAILSALASGDCQPLFDAIGQLQTMLEQIASDVWNGITDFFQPIGDFFSNLWQSFGAPIVDWLTAVAGDVWQGIQQLGSDIWAWTQPIRDTLSDGWDWVKAQLFGSAEGGDAASAESAGGLVGWVTQKAGEAWEAIKVELEPVIAPMQNFAESVVAFLPMDQIRSMRDTVTGFLGNVTTMTDNLSQPQDAVTNQASLRDDILPGVLATIGSVREGLVGAGGWITAQIGTLAQAVTVMIESIRSNALLSPVAGAIGWVKDTISQIYAFEQTVVMTLFNTLGDGLLYLSRFIEPIVNALQQLVTVLGDIVGQIGGFITGIWNLIPACIRQPLQQFITDQILSRIPFFSQLMQVPDVFARIGDTIMTILRQVFVDGNLLGALWLYFSTILELLGLPPDLVLNIMSKAAAAYMDILNDPIGFFLNLLRALKGGFIRFFDNIGTHLLSGVTNWLFGQLSEAGINPPADLSIGSIITFILDVLGVTVDNFFERLGNKIGKEKADRIRDGFEFASGAIRWIYRLVTEGPGALWEELKSQLSSLWSMVLDGVIGWLSKVIIVRATVYLLGLLDPTFIMTVVNSLIALYNIIETFVRYMRQILEAVNSVVEGIAGIARGAIDQAAGLVEASLVRMLPIAIAFCASLFGLGGLGKRIGEMVENVREYVNKGIDWLIDKGIAAFNALLAGGRAVVSAVQSWWQARETVREPNGTEHTLYFEPLTDGTYELTIASSPRGVLRFLAEVEGQVQASTPQVQQWHADARTLARQIRDDSIAGATSAAMATQLQNLAQIMGHLYGALLPAANVAPRTGEPGNPFEIKWHKPFPTTYPNIDLPNNLNPAGRANVSILNRTQVIIPVTSQVPTEVSIENILTRTRGQKQNTGYSREDAAARRSGAHFRERSFAELQQTVFTPPATIPTSGPTVTITIGVTPENMVHENSVLGPSIFTGTFRNSAVTRSYINTLQQAGFNWSGVNPEHVTDLYFGGYDIYENLWPLDSTLNRAPTQEINLTYGIDQDLVISRGLVTNSTDVRLALNSPQFGRVIGRNKYFIIRSS